MLLTARPLSQPPVAIQRTMQLGVRSIRRLAILVALIAFTAPTLLAQDVAGRASLTGVVKDVGTGAPVPGVTVKVQGMSVAVLTNDQGVYRIPNLSIGSTVAVEATRIGYGIQRIDNIRMDQAVVTRDISVNPYATTLDAITSSATSDPTSGVKIPMAVTKLDAEQMPVPNLSSGAYSIQGKVAGVSITSVSGAPGDSAVVQIRAIMSPFRNNAPLYVVDGVPLSDASNTAADFLGLDIESIEVIRGAAAASLYGSRASGGVIAITTKRGKDTAVGSSRIEFRQDLGTEDMTGLPKKRKSHSYKVNEYGQYLSNGVPSNVSSRALTAFRMTETPYVLIYDNLNQVMIPKQNANSRVSISQATATTNLNLSFNRVRTPGVFRYNPGNTQQNVRFFVSHQLRDNLSLDATVQHTRGNNRPNSPSTSFSTIFQSEPRVNYYLPGVDARFGVVGFKYHYRPDSASTQQSPLWLEYRYDYTDLRQRNLIATALQFRPYNWLSLNADFGYDKSDNGEDNWTEPGFPTSDTGVGTGALRYSNATTDAFDFNASARLLRDFGRMTTTLTLKGHQERQMSLSFSGSSIPLGLGSRSLSGGTSPNGGSSTSETRNNSFSANFKTDYAGKYIGDFLVLREGNSRFGPSQRWNNFYRASGAWLVSEEMWYPSFLNKLTLAKLRTNWGTAGGQPSFDDQFENVSVSNNLGFTRGTLGNPDLAAEIRTEFESGADFIWNNKISFQFSYSRQTLKDAITDAVAPAVTGYNTITSNQGTTRGESWEGTIEGTVMQRRIGNKQFRWNTNLVADRSKSTIVKLGRPCYGVNTFHPVCEGVPMTEIWGLKLMRTHDDLDQLSPSYTPYRDWWQVNDDGYLVLVGPGNSYTEGASKNLWGTAMSFNLGEPAGNFVFKADWGIPQLQRTDTTGGQSQRAWQRLGDSQQLASLGLNNRFNYGNLQFHMQMRGAIGGHIYNNYGWDSSLDQAHASIDQHMKPDSLRKPRYYFAGAAPGGGDSFSGLAVNNNSYGYSNWIVYQDWAKLSEAQVAYTMLSRDYRFLNNVGISRVVGQFTGRNLLTFKGDYPGLDPEATGSRNGGRFRYDTFRYPLTRQYSGSLTVVF